MYTLEQLQQKTFGELKAIGWELNVLPAGDRRRRETWIDAIAGVNPPLLQLLEVSPSEAQHPVIETVENALGVEVDSVQDIINQTWTSWEKDYCAWLKDAEWCVHKGKNKRIHAFLPTCKTLRLEGMKKGAEYCAIWEVSECTYDFSGLPLPVCSSLYAQEPIIETVETSPGVDVEPVPEVLLESKFGRIVYPRPVQEAIEPATKTVTGVEVDQAQEAIEYGRITGYLCRPKSPLEQAAKTSPGVEVDPVEDQHFPECVECFDDGFVEDESGVIKLCQCGSEPKLSHQNAQRAIALATENLPCVEVDNCVYCTSPEYSSLRDKSYRCYRCQPDEADLNPILMGISLSDSFLARYTPPQPHSIRFQAEADGQLSLVNFEVLTEPEPPDPDDFESLDAFREAISLWDAQNPEPLDVSMDSMCEWAPCPEEWYEPEAESLPLKASSMMELSPPAIESSSTSDFFIPTFDAWCDRSDRNDEPPDTGIFARLPKPKPPHFPPQANPSQVNQASRNYPETRLLHYLLHSRIWQQPSVRAIASGR